PARRGNLTALVVLLPGALWKMYQLYKAPRDRSLFCSHRSIHRRYYRRVIECRDGLVTVSSYLAMLGVTQNASPEAVARVLPAALRACAIDTAEASPAVGVALTTNSIDADVRQLVAVSQALEAEH
ncbi:DUF6545 domain-containing protein, partial [Streptomyces malaysiense]|uniref:DUF6545 domain-containing protein n=1 Tax=Streptomyces malaysiense TaxID=1428626 RepID=UPI0030B8046E